MVGMAKLESAGDGMSGRGIVYGGGAVYGVTGAANGLVRIDETDLSVLSVPLPSDAGATYVGSGGGLGVVSPI